MIEKYSENTPLGRRVPSAEYFLLALVGEIAVWFESFDVTRKAIQPRPNTADCLVDRRRTRRRRRQLFRALDRCVTRVGRFWSGFGRNHISILCSSGKVGGVDSVNVHN